MMKLMEIVYKRRCFRVANVPSLYGVNYRLIEYEQISKSYVIIS